MENIIEKGGVPFHKTKVGKLMTDSTPFHKTKVGKLMSDRTPFHKTKVGKLMSDRTPFHKTKVGKLFQKGGELKLDELKEFEDDFKKLGYELEKDKYVLKDTTKPALDGAITTLIEDNVFKPHKIESDDFIKDGNLLDCFKSGVKIDGNLAQKLFENKYKGSVKNKYEGTFEGSKITHPTHFIVRDTKEDYYFVNFVSYNTMERYGKTNSNGVQPTWSFIAGLEYRPFTHDLTDYDSTHNLSLDKIEAIEYFDVYMGIREQNKAIENIEESIKNIKEIVPSNPNANKFMKELSGNKKALRTLDRTIDVLGDKHMTSKIVSYIGTNSRKRKKKGGKKSRKTRKARKTKKVRKA